MVRAGDVRDQHRKSSSTSGAELINFPTHHPEAYSGFSSAVNEATPVPVLHRILAFALSTFRAFRNQY